MFSRALTISALVSFAAAQINLSQNCTQTLTSVATNPDVIACLTPSPLLPLLSGGGNTSIVDPINNWLTSLCAAGSCSNDTIAAIVKNVTTGCSVEASLLGIDASSAIAVTPLIQKYYPTARKVVCLKDGNTNCITETLKTFEGYFGPLSINNIIKLAGGDLDNVTTPDNVTCTNCAKAAYNIINTDIPGLIDADFNQGAQATCGANFTDGSNPTSVTQSASDKQASTPPPNGSGALALSVVSGTSVLAGIMGVFTLLA